MILRSADPSSKFITYFQLLDAFQEPGCPVCTRLEQAAQKALDGLMYEQVNDPVTRDRLLESHGFCNWHAWMLPSIRNSALGVALIYRHLLQETLEHLQAASREARPRGRWQRLRERLAGSHQEPSPILAWRSKKSRCYMCSFARRSERDDLRTILEFIGEAEFAAAFARSAGLCLPHLYAAMAIGRDHPNLPTLLAIHERRWQDLSWELEEFARKFDYRYADEARGRESSSWHRVLDVFVGRAGVFGPEREAGPVTQAAESAPPAPAEAGRRGGADADQGTEIESLRFENEKLHRRIETLLARQTEDRRTRLALEFQVLKLTADLKAMAVDLAVMRGEPSPADSTPGTIVSDGQPSPEGGVDGERVDWNGHGDPDPHGQHGVGGDGDLGRPDRDPPGGGRGQHLRTSQHPVD